jgi:hypothetical protein
MLQLQLIVSRQGVHPKGVFCYIGRDFGKNERLGCPSQNWI